MILFVSIAACLISVVFWIVTIWQKQRILTLYTVLEDSVDTPRHGLIFFDEHDRFIMANKQAQRLLPMMVDSHTRPKGLKGLLDFMFDHATDQDDDSILNTLDRTARKVSNLGFREIIQMEDGRLVLVEAQATKDKRTTIVLMDVSDMRHQEEKVIRLHQSNHELSQAIEMATNGIMIAVQEDKSHKLIFANQAFCGILGLDKSEIIGESVLDVLSALDDSETLEKIIQIIRRGESGDVQIHITAGGHASWHALKLTHVLDNAGKNHLSIGVFTDMTELKKREAEIFKGQKLEALGQLAAGVAHDFNNVLSIIDGYSRLTFNKLSADTHTQEREYLERVQVASARGANLIKQMLTFSRHKIVEETVIDLGAVLKEQETFLMPLLDATIKFDLVIDSADMFVECPPDNIVQILMNLVVNARDAMPSGGRILIALKRLSFHDLPFSVRGKETQEHEFACLCVTDSGTGMPKEVIERIFDPFYTTKAQGKGTGLGLSMVYGLVKQAGGTIDVHSVQGRGTTMSIYFPLSNKRPSRCVSGDLEDINTLRMEGYTVLIAEDEPDLLMLVSDMLRKLGMNVLQASDGNKALVAQDDYEGKIDILLTDVVMPELGGVELAELVHELRPDIKVIFMSGYPASGKMARVQLPENSYFMAKPIQYETLARLIYQRLREDTHVSDKQDPAFLKTAHWETRK